MSGTFDDLEEKDLYGRPWALVEFLRSKIFSTARENTAWFVARLSSLPSLPGLG